ncbi:hypothetical protein PoB_005436500 [Plakobranchus ocellatus]|uniref:Uncharacterized protein n=1 Tax=Plakobranchus ocellatus TaxID=259542 RepID=A0AAV4C848_9GAST|nr:hypothetical protein PoB_005436500 [Plakobranchus ocellatus]
MVSKAARTRDRRGGTDFNAGWEGSVKKDVYGMKSVTTNVMSDSQALLRLGRLCVGVELEPATEVFLHVSGRSRWPLCHHCPTE